MRETCLVIRIAFGHRRLTYLAGVGGSCEDVEVLNVEWDEQSTEVGPDGGARRREPVEANPRADLVDVPRQWCDVVIQSHARA